MAIWLVKWSSAHFFQSLSKFIVSTNQICIVIRSYWFCLASSCHKSTRAWIKESVSIVQVASICTPLLAKQLNKIQYGLRIELLSLMINDPNMSTPQWVNEAASQHLSFGKSDIYFPGSILHVTHLWTILLTTTLAPSTQIPFFCRLVKVNPFPPWPIISWLQITTASIILLVFGRTTGCTSLLVSLYLLILPPTCNTPLLQKKGI